MQIVEEAGRDGSKIFVNFVHNKYDELLDLDITILIIFFLRKVLKRLYVKRLWMHSFQFNGHYWPSHRPEKTCHFCKNVVYKKMI